MAGKLIPGTPPVSYPTVKVNGETLTVKFSLYAEYLLDEQDIRPPFTLKTPDGKFRYSLFLSLFAAMVAHNYKARGEEAPTPQDWAIMLDDDADKLKEFSTAVAAAFLKAKPSTEAIALRESEASSPAERTQ